MTVHGTWFLFERMPASSVTIRGDNCWHSLPRYVFGLPHEWPGGIAHAVRDEHYRVHSDFLRVSRRDVRDPGQLKHERGHADGYPGGVRFVSVQT